MRKFIKKHKTKVVGTNQPNVDPGLLQAAIDNAAPGDELKLRGTFDLGEEGVIILKDIIIKGDDNMKIKNGFYPIRVGGEAQSLESGPIATPKVSFENMIFENFTGAGIKVIGSTGVELKDLTFNDGILDARWKEYFPAPLCTSIWLGGLFHGFDPANVSGEVVIKNVTIDGKAFVVESPSLPARISTGDWSDNDYGVEIVPGQNDHLKLEVDGTEYEVVIPGDGNGEPSPAVIDSGVWDSHVDQYGNPIPDMVLITPTSKTLKIAVNGTNYQVDVPLPLNPTSTAASLIGGDWADLTVPYSATITTGVNDRLNVEVGGTDYEIVIPAGTYGVDTMAAEVNNLFGALGAPCFVYDTSTILPYDALVIETFAQGSGATLEIKNASGAEAAEDLGFTIGEALAGVDAGTVEEATTYHIDFFGQDVLNPLFEALEAPFQCVTPEGHEEGNFLRFVSYSAGSGTSLEVKSVANTMHIAIELSLGLVTGSDAGGAAGPRWYDIDEMIPTLQELFAIADAPVNVRHAGFMPGNDYIEFETHEVGSGASLAVLAASSADALGTLELALGASSEGVDGTPGGVYEQSTDMTYKGASHGIFSVMTSAEISLKNVSVKNVMDAGILIAVNDEERFKVDGCTSDPGTIGWACVPMILGSDFDPDNDEGFVLNNTLFYKKDLLPMGGLDIHVSNSMVMGNKIVCTNTPYGLLIEGSNNVFKNNTVQGTGEYGITVFANDGYISEGNLLEKCRIINFQASAADVSFFPDANNNIVHAESVDDGIEDNGMGNQVISGESLPRVFKQEVRDRLKEERYQIKQFNKICKARKK